MKLFFARFLTFGVLLCSFFTACSKNADTSNSSSAAIETINASEVSGISFEFVDFEKSEAQGRFAKIKLNNKSNFALIGYRGELLGYDNEKNEVYSFPWSSAAMPSLAEPGQSKETYMGFEIPDDVVSVQFRAEEYDIRK